MPDSTVSYLNNLAKTGWLSRQHPAFQTKVLSIGRWVTLSAGKRLYTIGDVSDALVGVDQGGLDVLVPISDEEEFPFFRAGAGFWLGDGGLLRGEPRTLSLEAATQSRVFVVPHHGLRQHLAKNPADWSCLYDLAVDRGLMTARLVGELIGLKPNARIARLMLRLAGKDGSVLAKQEDLAGLVGISRQTFRRAIKDLMAAGAIETQYGNLRVIDVEAVKREAGL